MENFPFKRLEIKRPLRYQDVNFALDARAPLGHPHIIHQDFSEQTDIADLRAIDGVVTLLYRWSQEGLLKFLDLSNETFAFSRWDPDSAYPYTIIIRRGEIITVSAQIAKKSQRAPSDSKSSPEILMSFYSPINTVRHEHHTHALPQPKMGYQALLSRQQGRCLGAAFGPHLACWTIPGARPRRAD